MIQAKGAPLEIQIDYYRQKQYYIIYATTALIFSLRVQVQNNTHNLCNPLE